MIRVIGAGLIVGAMGWMGWQAGNTVKQRLFLLRRLIYSLEKIQREVSFRRVPLPRLLALLSKEEAGLLAEFWSGCAQGAGISGEEFRRCWKVGTENLGVMLDRTTKQVLQNVGQGLGRYDGEGEEMLLKSSVSELEAHLRKLTEENGQTARLYQTLGVTTGVFLALILM